MNYIKLNELAAQIMAKSHPHFDAMLGKGWNPCEDLNDASALLEKVCDGRSWNVNRNHKNYSGLKYIVITNKEPYKINCGEADTEALAKTICALRAAGIMENEIQDAINA